MSRRYLYLKVTEVLSSIMKGLTKIHNNYSKCFRWCDTRHWSSVYQNLNVIRKYDKEYFKKHIKMLHFP